MLMSEFSVALAPFPNTGCSHTVRFTPFLSFAARR